MAGAAGLKERLDRIAVAEMRDMCQERVGRMARARAGDATAVEGGIWYGNDCQELWTAAGKVEELVSLKAKGRLFHGHAPTTHWRKPKDKTKLFGRAILIFDLKKGRRPSEALRAEGPWIIDCRTTIERARYLALEQVLGTDIFNAVFAADGPAPLRLGMLAPDGKIFPMLPLLRQRRFSSLAKVRPGDWVCFAGGIFPMRIPADVPRFGGALAADRSLYSLKHVDGEGANSNVLCVSGVGEEALFVGFGHAPEGESAREVAEHLFQEYNAAPITLDVFLPLEVCRQHLEKTAHERMLAEALKGHQLSREAFRAQGGGTLPSQIATSFDELRVAALAAAETPDQAREIYAAWMAEFI